jgi:hypothetical protein
VLLGLTAIVLIGIVLPGCATKYSPKTVREEIVRQRGVDPRSSFELKLGRIATYLIKSAMTTQEGDTPFAGLRGFELAVYGTPEGPGPAVDVTQFKVRGWEQLVRAHDERRSFMILIRASGSTWEDSLEDAIGDLVVLGAGKEKVVYGRLQGVLSPDLPEKLGELFRGGGPEALADTLSELSGTQGEE